MKEKNVKIIKRAHSFKGYASSYSVEILNSFDTKLQLNDNKSANKNKLKKILTKLRGFKFVTTLVLVLKKIKQNMTHFIYTQKQKQLLMEVTLMIMYLNQSILKLHQT